MVDMYSRRIEVGKSFWKDAAVGGGIIGLVVVVCNCLPAFEGVPVLRGLLSIVEIALFVYVMYKMLRKRSNKYGDLGFSFGQAFSYVLAMMIFAGFVLGVVMFLTVRSSPDMLNAAFQSALEGAGDVDGVETMVRNMINSPLFWIFVSIFIMGCYGGFVGLFVSPFVKRAPVLDKTENKDDE